MCGGVGETGTENMENDSGERERERERERMNENENECIHNICRDTICPISGVSRDREQLLVL